MVAVETITVELDVDVAMRDGVILKANVHRPPAGRWPALLMRLPYSKDARYGRDVLEPVAAAARGYAVVVQDTRGCYASEGEWTAFVHEEEDGADTIAWLRAQPWCDGRVGMYGASYYGYTQWAAAIARPAGLAALVPFISAGASFGPDDAAAATSREFGAFCLWELEMALADRLRGGESHTGASVRELVATIDSLASSGYRELAAGKGPAASAVLATAAASALPAASALSAGGGPPAIDYGTVTVPALHVGGWFDIFLRETLTAFQAQRRAGVPAKVLVGPWSHGYRADPVGEVAFGMAAAIDWMGLHEGLADLQYRWFDHWLKGIDTGVMDEPPVRVFVMGASSWRDEDDWPLSRATVMPAYLGAGGRLTRDPPLEAPPDSFEARGDDPVPTVGGPTLLASPLRAGPMDQRSLSDRPDVLEYATAPLREDVEITGPVRLRLWVGCEAAAFDLVARLVEIAPDGRRLGLTDGLCRAGSAPPREPRELLVDLGATSMLFRAGSRIGLHVTWSSFPRWAPLLDPGDASSRPVGYEVLHDQVRPSCLELPIVSGDPLP